MAEPEFTIAINSNVEPKINPDAIMSVKAKLYRSGKEIVHPNDKLDYLWTMILTIGQDTEAWKLHLSEVLQLSRFVGFNTTKPHSRSGKLVRTDSMDKFVQKISKDKDLLLKFIYGDAVVYSEDNAEYYESENDDYEVID